MRRNTSRLIGLLLIFYIIGQSVVLFYGQINRITLFTRTLTRNSVVKQQEKVPTIEHQTFAIKASLGNSIKLGSAEPYINVDLTNLSDVLQKTKIYPSFELTMPNFIDNRSASVFLKKKDNLLDGLVRTPAQLYGELYVVRNGTYDTKLDCGYKSESKWVTTERRVSKSSWHDILVPLIVPDGHTFQHFLDGTLPKLIQALPVLQNNKVKILMRNLRDKIIFEIFDRLNISRDQLVFSSGGVVGANILIFPCITPPIHPQLWQEGRRLITRGLAVPRPYSEALVIFVTRKGCHNCGRRVLNQEKVVEMLNGRYGSDLVRTFDGPQGLQNAVDLFSRARIVMGPHGGGMYNINFAPSKTVVIEFMPTKDNGDVAAAAHQIIWHMAQLLDQEFWRMCIPPSGGSDMNVDLKQLSDLLDVVDKRHGA